MTSVGTKLIVTGLLGVIESSNLRTVFGESLGVVVNDNYPEVLAAMEAEARIDRERIKKAQEKHLRRFLKKQKVRKEDKNV